MRHMIIALAGAFVLASCGNAEEGGNTEEDSHISAAVEGDTQVADAKVTGTSGSDSDAVGGREGTWGDIIYGNPDAPIEVIEYASLTCPHCANFALNIFPKIKEKYIDTGKVRFVYRNFVMNRYDLAASTAARCGSPETTKQLMKLYFSRQNDWARSQNPVDELASIARRAGLSRAKLDQCLANVEMHQHLIAMTKGGVDDFKVEGTPTIIVDGKKAESYGWEHLDELLSDKF